MTTPKKCKHLWAKVAYDYGGLLYGKPMKDTLLVFCQHCLEKRYE